MSVNAPLKLVLCWHMHQPNYLDPVTGEYKLPWTYLHAIKDYADMAAHLETIPGARAVVNFAPILLEQIDHYASQLQGFLHHDSTLHDPLLAALVTPALPVDNELRCNLIRHCLRVNRETVINRFPPFQRLVALADALLEGEHDLLYINEQYLADLLVWYHLAWMGESVRRGDARIGRLMEKARDYTLHDRHELLQVIAELMSEIIPRYRRLAEAGRVELSFTPYAHPILPLLIDLASAREALEEARLPLAPGYPGGLERCHWHIRTGLETFERYFGHRPRGCWPSEGGISDATLALLAEHGLQWTASGESVLRNSLEAEELSSALGRDHCIHRIYRSAAGGPACFFRDDGLSDKIGFEYAQWDAEKAVNDLLHHLGNIATSCAGTKERVVSIIMDGENAWEYYPENAYAFLATLYGRLAGAERIELTTFSDCVERLPGGFTLPRLVAGSWVYGTFSTWIGEADKNRAWDMLVEARQVYERVVSTHRIEGARLRELERQLAVCEGSDWFWWFGDYNPAAAVAEFEQLYRLQLSTLYQMLDEEPPDYLAHSFTHGGGHPQAGGTMRHGREAE